MVSPLEIQGEKQQVLTKSRVITPERKVVGL